MAGVGDCVDAHGCACLPECEADVRVGADEAQDACEGDPRAGRGGVEAAASKELNFRRGRGQRPEGAKKPRGGSANPVAILG